MDPRPWVPKWDPDARRRLICFGPAGRGTSDFHAWRERLPGGLDVLPVVLPGRERRLSDPLATTWPELLNPLSDRLADLVETSDYVVYGHSMGAWVGYELVRRFRAMGVPMPLHLVVGARRAPQVPDPLPSLARLDDAAFVAAVQERYGGIPDQVRNDPEILALFLPMMRADFALLDGYTYEPSPPLDVPITAVLGLDDDLVSSDLVVPWGELTSRTFQIRHVTGGHFFLRDAAIEVTDFLAQLFHQEL
ncbi:MAG: alpha/beta fold hydrolase [Myxococcota bacterium]